MRNFYLLSLLLFTCSAMAQSLPAYTENVNYISTFGKDCSSSWGDDDNVQAIFFMIPKSRTTPFYIRVFDPECGGKIDKMQGSFNSKTRYSILGGRGCYSDKDARGIDPVGNYKSGQLLVTKTFDSNTQYDEKWYTFKALNPTEGEYIKEYDAYIFKLIVEGFSGDDGNLYRVFLSDFADDNTPISGGNIFTYEYSLRLHTQKSISTHITPYIDENVSEVHIYSFDFDDDGEMFLYSMSKNRHVVKYSGNNVWSKSVHKIEAKEQKTSVDIQIVKGSASENDLCLYITNKYNIPIPMFSIPIGGHPIYPLKTDTKRIQK